MPALSLPYRRSGRKTTLAATSAFRPDVCPPSLRCEPGTAWQRWLYWLLAPAPHDATPPLSHLPGVRRAFKAALCDLQSGDADALRQRIDQARSLRDLWHVRADIFRVVGLARTQFEAERRLTRLDHHFQNRAVRSASSPP